MARLLTAALALLIVCNDPFFPAITGQFAPLVVFTFDDAHESIYSYGYRLMRYLTLNENQRPFPFSQFPAEVEPPDDAVRFE